MTFLIFIKNIKKMNCLVRLICVVNNSEMRLILSKYILGKFLEDYLCKKILSLL